jgi:hypothetical protein
MDPSNAPQQPIAPPPTPATSPVAAAITPIRTSFAAAVNRTEIEDNLYHLSVAAGLLDDFPAIPIKFLRDRSFLVLSQLTTTALEQRESYRRSGRVQPRTTLADQRFAQLYRACCFLAREFHAIQRSYLYLADQYDLLFGEAYLTQLEFADGCVMVGGAVTDGNAELDGIQACYQQLLALYRSDASTDPVKFCATFDSTPGMIPLNRETTVLDDMIGMGLLSYETFSYLFTATDAVKAYRKVLLKNMRATMDQMYGFLVDAKVQHVQPPPCHRYAEDKSLAVLPPLHLPL